MDFQLSIRDRTSSWFSDPLLHLPAPADRQYLVEVGVSETVPPFLAPVAFPCSCPRSTNDWILEFLVSFEYERSYYLDTM